MENLTELPIGRRRKRKSLTSSSTDYSKCVICQKETAESLQRITEKGYGSLVYAVNNRSDDISCRLSTDILYKEEFLSISPKCHSDCRNQYTNKKTVEQKKRLRDDCKSQILVKEPPKMPCSYKMSLENVCFVCEKERGKKDDRTLLLVA